MTRQTIADNLVRVKTALADKYERLARVSKSKSRRASLLHTAERHRAQAANGAKSAAR